MLPEVTVLRLHLVRCDVELHNADVCQKPPPADSPPAATLRPPASSCRCFAPPRIKLPFGRRLRGFRYAKTTRADLCPGVASWFDWLPVLPCDLGVRTAQKSMVEG